MNNLDKKYQDLLKDIMENGHVKSDRTGTGTKSVFGRSITHKMSEGFPLLTTKKMYTKGIVTELLWFLRGETNIRPLVLANCHIWDGDAYKKYCNHFAGYEDVPSKEWFIDEIKNNPEFAAKWGDLGPIYGKQWRSWEHTNKGNFINLDNSDDPELRGRGLFFKTDEIDQIANAINDLKTNPDSRRIIVNAWNVGEIDDMTLPPCHYGFQVYTRELSDEERVRIYWDKRGIENPMLPALRKDIENENIPTRAISLMWNQRSVDTLLGLPFNIASYGLLLEIIAKEVNMVPDEIIGILGDTHLYLNHLEQAKEQITREPFDLPTLDIQLGDNQDFGTTKELYENNFVFNDYKSHTTIKAELSN